jgi:acetyl esterase/lipase
LFGDIAPCSLLLGAMTYFPDTTVAFKTIPGGNTPPVVSTPDYPFDHKYVPYDPVLNMDIYYPKQHPTQTEFPIFLYYHGGGLRYGDRKRDVPLCTVQYLLDRGIAFVSVDYRVLQHGFNGSAILTDAYDAVRFLKAHGADYRLNSDKIVVSGNSAGGNLAMMVGYGLNASMVAGVLTLWGVEPGYNPTNRSFEHYASPTEYITASSPPTLLIHGGADTAVSVQASQHVADRLRQFNVTHQMVRVPAQNHACDIEPFGPCYVAESYTLQYFLKNVYGL